MTEVFENADTNDPSDVNRTDSNSTDDTPTNVSHTSDLWHYMTKQENQKAKCTLCNIILSRRNGATSGLRKHLSRVHQIELSTAVREKSRAQSDLIPPDEKKKLDSLIIDCIIQDGRSFDDMRRPGILKVFNHLRPSKKNICWFILFISFLFSICASTSQHGRATIKTFTIGAQIPSYSKIIEGEFAWCHL